MHLTPVIPESNIAGPSTNPDHLIDPTLLASPNDVSPATQGRPTAHAQDSSTRSTEAPPSTVSAVLYPRVDDLFAAFRMWRRQTDDEASDYGYGDGED